MLGIVGSFNPSFYKKIVKQSLLKSIGFLVVFVFIFTAGISYRYTLYIKAGIPKVIQWFDKNFSYLVSDLPPIEISDGEVVSPEKTYIKEWKDVFVFVIEPNEENLETTLKEYPNVLVLSQRSLSIKTTEPEAGKSKVETYDLKNIEYLKITPTETGITVNFETNEIEVTPATLERISQKISGFIYPVIFLWFFLVYCFTKPLQLLIFSIISLLFNSNLKSSLSYKQLLNIGTYALVPPTSLAVIKDVIGLRIPLFFVVYSLVYIIYLFWGIKAVSTEVWKE